ncbi:uncharacterized protein LOC131148911 [Malania oleifera]|uniref:uncharacterized protein LOC131148911 n=1 Tax=Malania oleifera TaxID=397392 RepID=UPI0025ADACF8|nr:uncharacterized protein LOC131148911 [Malania oleifera]XP_057954858.1 uncharacterized protein LOC131148911 [Malania oleifera]
MNERSKMKYGLQIRVQSSQKKQIPTKAPLPTSLGFRDDDEDDVEKEISRHASKNKVLKDIEEQHKKALEEDPSVFDYDGVYDEMKEKELGPRAQDRQERKSKYIHAMMNKSKERERLNEIVYERNLAKERSKEDHLYAEKDKFVTSAYKKKLAEQAKWLEEERLRELRDKKDDVTKKSDMSDFYFNLSKNVAFGAKDAELRKSKEQEVSIHVSEKGSSLTNTPLKSSIVKEKHQGESSSGLKETAVPFDAKPASATLDSVQENIVAEQEPADQPKHDHHKRSEDQVAAAKERFLARKRAKVQ